MYLFFDLYWKTHVFSDPDGGDWGGGGCKVENGQERTNMTSSSLAITYIAKSTGRF